MCLKMCKAEKQRALHLSGECSTKAWYCRRSGLVAGLDVFHEVIRNNAWLSVSFLGCS